jgi:hypothetical protein
VTNMCHPPRLFHHHRPAQPVKHATNNPWARLTTVILYYHDNLLSLPNFIYLYK